MISSASDLKVLKVIIALVFIFCSSDSVFGRKCVCTSKACKESGAKTCRTRFSCYTELIYSGESTATAAAAGNPAIKTTRGCTEGATPLLCETKSWRGASDEQQESSNSNSLEQLGKVAWPRLTCCDDRDYCNAADEDFETTSAHPEDRQSNRESTSEFPSNRGYDHHARSVVSIDDNAKTYQNVHTLHVAALVLAIAALISVFAACYVVTRFLNASGANSGLPRILNPYSNSNGMDV